MILIQDQRLGGSIYKAYDVYKEPRFEPLLEVSITYITAGGIITENQYGNEI